MSIPLVIVDDDLNYLSVVKVVLETQGFRVFTAADIRTALEVINKENPDVILVDWSMPGGDGVALVKALKSSPLHTDRYVIMVTARKDLTAKLQGMEAGADDYLTKPFENQELLARVRVGVRTRELQRAMAENARRNTVVEMAVSVAHEIGNPLATAKLFQQSLLRTPEIQNLPKVQEALNVLGQQLTRIEGLVRKAQSITSVKSVPYIDDITMIDLRGTGDQADKSQGSGRPDSES